MEQSVHTAHIESVTTGLQADIPSLSKYRYSVYPTKKAVLM